MTAVDYRKLPAVEPVEIPRRFSTTLIAKADDCPRSAYLYARHKGGPGSHPLDRGTLLHAVLERAMKTLIANGEPAFAPDDPVQAASMMAALVDEVLRERPDLVVPRREVDDVREAAYHWSVGYDVDPEHVAGLERLMVLDLDCGWTISGRMDLIALPGELGQVDDFKSGQHIPSQAEYEGSVQPWVYAVLLCFGVPVDVTPCPMEEGKGYVETRGEPFGQHLRGVLTREVYPHPKPRDDGLLHMREMLLSRTAIADYRADLERMVSTLAERFVSWEFPARSSGGADNSSWCSRCPAPAECPIPVELRDHAGSINSVAEATEAWTLAQHERARWAAVEREVKAFCKAHNAEVRVGDQVWSWQVTEGRAVRKKGRGSDWDGLQAALTEAVEFGKPFEMGEWLLTKTGSRFEKSKEARTGGST